MGGDVHRHDRPPRLEVALFQSHRASRAIAAGAAVAACKVGHTTTRRPHRKVLNADKSPRPQNRLTARITAAARTVRSHPAWPFTLAGLLILAAIGVFADLAEDVVTTDHITVIDQQWAQWLHAHGTPWLTRTMLALSTMHDMLAMSVYTLLLAAFLLWRRQRDWMICLLLVVPGGMAINTLTKHLIGRPRPQFTDPIVTLATFSFPSGHVAASTLFYGFLVSWLISRTHAPGRRLTAVAAALLMVALVATSRMYLGAHFFSDVLAAFFECVAWLGLCLLGKQAMQSGAGPRQGSTG